VNVKAELQSLVAVSAAFLDQGRVEAVQPSAEFRPVRGICSRILGLGAVAKNINNIDLLMHSV
jgi:hypothetical protein